MCRVAGQFYISCAQIKVTGGGSGSPSPKVAIPGVYTGNEPGILLSIWWPIREFLLPFIIRMFSTDDG